MERWATDRDELKAEKNKDMTENRLSNVSVHILLFARKQPDSLLFSLIFYKM